MAAGSRAARQVAMAATPKLCIPAPPKDVTVVPTAVITVDFSPVAADFLISLRRLFVSPRIFCTL